MFVIWLRGDVGGLEGEFVAASWKNEKSRDSVSNCDFLANRPSFLHLRCHGETYFPHVSRSDSFPRSPSFRRGRSDTHLLCSSKARILVDILKTVFPETTRERKSRNRV